MVEIRSKDIRLVPIGEIKLNPKNRNSHSKEQIDRLAQIIKYQGFRNPGVVSNRTGILIAGEGRYLAAKQLGLEAIPCIFQDFDDETQEFTYGISDNSISSWSELDLSGINADIGDFGPFDLDLLGIKNFTVDVADKLGECDEDEIPEHVEPRTKLGDLYKLGNHRLLCGDSTSIDAVEKLMDGEKADMVFTDPPYGIGLDKEGQTIGKSQAYGAVLNDHSNEVAIDAFNLVTGLQVKSIFFWGANHFSNALPSSPCWIVWDKQGGKHVTYADVELCYSNIDAPARLFTHIWDGFRRDSEKGDKRVHPTQKPVELICEIWKFFDRHCGMAVLDLFGGSGSTLIACEKTNRKAYLMELDPKYCSVIVERWCKYTGQEAYLVNEDGTQTAWTEIKAMVR